METENGDMRVSKAMRKVGGEVNLSEGISEESEGIPAGIVSYYYTRILLLLY